MIQKRNKTEWVVIGRIGKPLGLRGDFYLRERSGFLPESSTKVMVGPDLRSATAGSITESRRHKGKDTIRLSLFHDRTALEPHIGSKIWVEELTAKSSTTPFDSLKNPKGYKIVDALGQEMGEAIEKSNFGASDLVTVRLLDGLFIDIPIVEDYIAEVFVDSKTVRLRMPADFFDELRYS